MGAGIRANASTAAGRGAGRAPGPEAAVPAAPALPGEPAAPGEPVQPLAFASAERVEVVTDVIRAEIDTLGGDLRRVWLLKHPVSVDQPDQPFPLFKDSEHETFIAQSGIVGHGGDFPTHKVRYAAAETRYALPAGQNELRVPLTWRAPDGTRYAKTYVFRRDSYLVTVEYTIDNATDRQWAGFPYAQLVRSYVQPPGLFAIPTYTGGAIYTPEDKYQRSPSTTWPRSRCGARPSMAGSRCSSTISSVRGSRTPAGTSSTPTCSRASAT